MDRMLLNLLKNERFVKGVKFEKNQIIVDWVTIDGYNVNLIYDIDKNRWTLKNENLTLYSEDIILMSERLADTTTEYQGKIKNFYNNLKIENKVD